MTTTAEVAPGRGWTADASTFGARLALVRQRKGWGNVREAARACGVPTETWRNWERDGVEPRRIVLMAKQIAAVAGCDYVWLLEGPEPGGDTRRYRPERVVAKAGRTPGRPGPSPAPVPPPPRGPVGPVPRTRPLVGVAI